MDNYLYDIDVVIHSGMVVMIGGFGGHGTPLQLIDLLSRSQKISDLTIISNDTGLLNNGLFLLLKKKG